MNDRSRLHEVARELRRLSASSPSDRSSLAAWYEEAQAFAARLGTEYAAVDLPEEVWHFLHDADIRAKDPEFREAQIRMISEVIRDLESGRVPEPRGVAVALDGRWLLVAAALLVVAIAAWVAV